MFIAPLVTVAKVTWVFVNQWMSKPEVITHIMEYYSALKRKGRYVL
jgi:hypothetical protein